VNNEDDESRNDKNTCTERTLLRGGVFKGQIVCANDNATLLAQDEVEPVGEPTAFLKLGTLWVLLLSRSRLASVPLRSWIGSCPSNSLRPGDKALVGESRWVEVLLSCLLEDRGKNWLAEASKKGT